jgi:hypothetical protein
MAARPEHPPSVRQAAGPPAGALVAATPLCITPCWILLTVPRFDVRRAAGPPNQQATRRLEALVAATPRSGAANLGRSRLSGGNGWHSARLLGLAAWVVLCLSGHLFRISAVRVQSTRPAAGSQPAATDLASWGRPLVLRQRVRPGRYHAATDLASWGRPLACGGLPARPERRDQN